MAPVIGSGFWPAWIARVPILGFLFKEEGYNDERESLMILIKATILDIQSTVEEKLERRY